MKLQARLLWVVLPLLATSILIASLALALQFHSTLLDQARHDGELLANVLARNAGLGETVEEGVENLVSKDLASSAHILAHYIAIAEKCRIPASAIRRQLGQIVSPDDLSEIWITDAKGKAYLTTTGRTGFQFTPDAGQQPQASAFWPLLGGNPSLVVQKMQPRELDGRLFKYAGVSGIDHPRIVQVGLDGHRLGRLKEEIGTQELLNRATREDMIDRVWLVNENLEKLHYAASGSPAATPPPLPGPQQNQLRTVLKQGKTETRIEAGYIAIAAPIRKEVIPEDTPQTGNPQPVIGALLMLMPTHFITRLTTREALIASGITILVLLAGALAMARLTRRLVHPVSILSDAAQALQAGAFVPAGLDAVARQRDEAGQLAQTFRQMASAIQKHRETLESEVQARTLDLARKNSLLEMAREQIQSELDAAKALQLAILPPRFPSTITGFQGAGLMKAARQLSGDFYDFIELGPGRLGLLVADVSDKGVTASFFMAISHTILRHTAEHTASPSECLRLANQRICKSNPMSLFVTVFYGILDTRTGELTYSNGGHLLPWRVSAHGDPVRLERPLGALLGISEDVTYEEARIQLQAEDRLVLYSDGITEAFSLDQEAYGDERFAETLTECGNATPERILETVLESVEDFTQGAPQSDDITLVVLARTG